MKVHILFGHTRCNIPTSGYANARLFKLKSQQTVRESQEMCC